MSFLGLLFTYVMIQFPEKADLGYWIFGVPLFVMLLGLFVRWVGK
jgi:hypothetical protein